jgi:lysophospholipase L1-like esterase
MPLSFLSLGDSYTIGEGVLLADSFPYQTVQLLRKAGINACAPEIIAKTAWTTDELSASIERTRLLEEYDLVCLLIGVNDQYRGRAVDEFRSGFKKLVEAAIRFSGGHPQNVYLLSIPDWGVTPFAEGRKRCQVAEEIDAFNEVCKMVSGSLHCKYIDITLSQRTDGNNPVFLAADGLHPSGKEYSKWANLLATSVLSSLQQK